MATLVRFDPYRDVAGLREEMNRLFSRAFGDTAGTSNWTPAMDVFDRPDQVELTLELPGLQADDVDIEIDDNVLTISGERRFSEEVDDDRYYRLERAYGRFSRSLTLPQGVKADEISASFDSGVLRVRVPKADEVKPRKIAVSTSTS